MRVCFLAMLVTATICPMSFAYEPIEYPPHNMGSTLGHYYEAQVIDIEPSLTIPGGAANEFKHAGGLSGPAFWIGFDPDRVFSVTVKNGCTMYFHNDVDGDHFATVCTNDEARP